MADWIKMRSGLLTNPKVIRMARLLAESRYFMEWWTRGTQKSCDESVYELCDVTVVTRVTVGSLLPVWAAVNDSASGDGFVKGITLFEVDEMAGVPGFGEAMAQVGWVEQTDDGLRFSNFSEHNAVAKERSTGAKTGSQRTKEWRERKSKVTGHGDVTVTSHGDHREEKRREEKKTPKSPTQPEGFEEFWSAYPKKVDKPAAIKAFRKLEAPPILVTEMLGAIEEQRHTESWTKANGQYVPNPATWLNGHRWEDRIEPGVNGHHGDSDPMMGAK